MTEQPPTRFSSSLPIIVLTRPAGEPGLDWHEIDRGPGYFSVPAEEEIRVRVKSIDDAGLAEVVDELKDVAALRFLDLSENRNITNDGLARLHNLPQLTGLNLSSCTLTSPGIEHLRALPNLVYLNLSFCNRLSDPALKILEAMHNLTYVDIQGCLSITKGGIARIRRKSLTVYR